MPASVGAIANNKLSASYHALARAWSVTHGVIQFYKCAIISALLISIIELSSANNKILSMFRLKIFRRSTFRMFPVFTRINFFGRPYNNNDSRKSLYLLITGDLLSTLFLLLINL